MVRVHLLAPEGEYLWAGDEVVMSKAGKATHGWGRFYSSLAQRPINRVAVMTVSLIDVRARRAYPLQVEQREPPVSIEQSIVPGPQRKRRRPTGSENHVKPEPQLSPDLTLLQQMVSGITARIAPLTVNHLVLDGHWGNYPATYAVRQTGVHISSPNFAMMWLFLRRSMWWLSSKRISQPVNAVMPCCSVRFWT